MLSVECWVLSVECLVFRIQTLGVKVWGGRVGLRSARLSVMGLPDVRFRI